MRGTPAVSFSSDFLIFSSPKLDARKVLLTLCLGQTDSQFSDFFVLLHKWNVVKLRKTAVRKYRLGVCKMKKSKNPKLCQNIGLGKLFLEK